jgi:glycerate kinase
VTARTRSHPHPAPASRVVRSAPRERERRRAGVPIPDRLLLAVCAFGADMTAERVVSAIARGVRAGGMPDPDLCPIEDGAREAAMAMALDAVGFDARMRRARAVIVGAGRLDRGTLPGSAVFEIATRARQAGVPAYAVTGCNELDAFDARMLDLQVILEARTPRGLSAAGRELARLA